MAWGPSGCYGLLGQLQAWPTINLESGRAVGVDHDVELRHIFPLLPESIAHALGSGSSIQERDGRGGINGPVWHLISVWAIFTLGLKFMVPSLRRIRFMLKMNGALPA